ncbi:MAG: DUF3794 domain-containing protein [Oscillospiraceae bacterium]
MATQLFFDSLSSTHRLFDSGFEQSVELEILLADYDPPVFKIVKTCIEHTLTQKYISGSKLTLEGFFKLSVYYQPPQSTRLALISKKIPFQKQFELPQTVETPYFISVSGETQYINTRAINPTRIDVRGAYQFIVKAYATQEKSIVTAINSKTICTDDTQVDFFCLSAQGVRQFSVEDELTMPQDTEQILQVIAKNNNMSLTAYEGKVNVKGEITADIWHTVQSTDEVKKYSKAFLYNQVVDIQGVSENNIAYGDFSLISFTITQNPDTKKVNCVVTAQLDVRAFKKQEIIALTDAFSKEYTCSVDKETVIVDENLISLAKNFSFTMEDTLGKGYSIAYAFVETGAVRGYPQLDKTVPKLKLTISAIAKNSQGEYECFTKTEDCPFELSEPLSPLDELILSPQLNDYSTLLSDEKLTVKLSITLSGFIIKRKEIDVLNSFDELLEKPLEKSRQALILYYAHKNEKIFDIARRYKTSTQQILLENEIDGKLVPEDKMLFIPAFDM